MTEKLYEVVFINKSEDKNSLDEVSVRLKQHFGLNDDALKMLFSGKPVVVKSGVDLDKAEQLAKVIKSDGGECWVQEIGNSSAHEERRKGFRRTESGRRDHVRSSAIIPDRRKNAGRRNKDPS